MVPPASERKVLSGVYVVVVDDNVDARDILKKQLTYYGATVRVVAAAENAADIIRFAVPDVIITDLAMPALDGRWLLREVRRWPRGGTVPIIALTAHSHRFTEGDMLAAGFNAYLTKPVDGARLAQIVAGFVGR